MKKPILLIALCAFITGGILAQPKGSKMQQRKAAAENTLKAYFNAINTNDQAKWEKLIDLPTLGWGTRDSLPWLVDPNMPSVKSPRDAASGMASGKRQHKPYTASGSESGIAVEPTSWIRDSLFLRLQQNSFSFDDVESITIRRGLAWGTRDSLPYIKAFILLKPGQKVIARVPGDEFRGVSHSVILNGNPGDFIAPDLLGMYLKDPKSKDRMLSMKLQRRPGGSFKVVHNDDPVMIVPYQPRRNEK